MNSVLGLGSIIERFLEDQRLVPAHAVYADVSDARAARRERKLAQHALQSRQHFGIGEAGEPDIEIKRIRHRESIVRLDAVRLGEARAPVYDAARCRFRCANWEATPFWSSTANSRWATAWRSSAPSGAMPWPPGRTI